MNKNWSYARFYTFFGITSKVDLTEQEIVETVRETDDYILRPHKSTEDAVINDMMVVEKSHASTTYGCYYYHDQSQLWFINPMGATEKGVNHFVHTLYLNTPSNYVARTKRIYNENGEPLKN